MISARSGCAGIRGISETCDTTVQPTDFDEPRLSRLIGHLYDAALDETLWPGTATRIAQVLGSESAVVKLHHDDARVSLLECTDNLVVSERQRAWADEWHRRDLWVERSVACGMSRVITDEDLVTPEEQERSGFYQEWLRHLAIHHLLGAVFPAADGAVGVPGIHRSRRAGPYTHAQRRLASALLPHLQRALRLGQRLAAASRSDAAALQALDRLDSGVLVVDGSCRIVCASAVAERLLRENEELGVVGGCLVLRPPALQNRLLSLVDAALNTARGTVSWSAAALSVPRAHRVPLAIEVAPLRPSESRFGDERPRALLFVLDPEAPVAVERLRELFGLTPAEGTVAAALVRGGSLDDIAVQMGIGLATVRTHLKRILAKTGTHRQAQAVALMARSSASNPGA
jgi:DNA-binding CsgD family transcriptional regulator